MKDRLSFILFSFSFYFSFDLLSILNLGLEFSMISYVMVTKYHINVTWCHISVTVTQSHNHISQWKMVEGFRRNDIIQYIIYILILK